MRINRPHAAPNASLKLKKKTLDKIGAFTPYNQRQLIQFDIYFVGNRRQHEVMFLSYLRYYLDGQNKKRKTKKNCLPNRICRNKFSKTETKTSGIRMNICIF